MPRNKFAWLALIVVAAVFITAGLSRISFNVDILKLLPTHLPQVEGLSLFLKKFAQPNELILTLQGDDAEQLEQAADTLAQALNQRPELVKRAVAKAPYEKNPAELAELLAFLVLNRPPEEIQALLARITPEQAGKTIESTLEKLNDSVSPMEIGLRSYDPYDFAAPLMNSGLMSGTQQSEFSSADGTFRVIYVESAKPFRSYKDNIAWITEIKQITEPIAQPLKVKLGYTGEPAFVADISGSMEWDMKTKSFITLAAIAAIFYFCYRRLRPLIELQAMLILILLLALATSGLMMKELTVMSVGFAAIMIGLSVDYGYFVYQRSQVVRGDLKELRRECLQNIAWTASTTASAFFALNLSSLPGLSQLGNLVGFGVIIGSCVMLGLFAPLTHRYHRHEEKRTATAVERFFGSQKFMLVGSWFTLVLVLVLLGGLVVKGWPGVDFSADSLRPKKSEAYEALNVLQSRLVNDRSMLSLVVRGTNEDEVLKRLQTAEAKLSEAKARGEITSFRSVLPIWPHLEHQKINLPLLSTLTSQLPRLKQTMVAGGFNEEAFVLTENIVKFWTEWAQRTPPIWPENATSQWIFRRAASREPGNFLALGMVEPVEGREEKLTEAVQTDGVFLVSWQQLGSELKKTIPREFRNIILVLSVITVGTLAWGFRSWRAVLIFIGITALVLVCLCGALSLLGQKWNFFSLASLLLLLGTGTDYSILLLLALRRNGGDIAAAHREMGIVVALCASSAAAGFGTIAGANNHGLASLGLACAIGLILDALISVFLLPRLWALAFRKTP